MATLDRINPPPTSIAVARLVSWHINAYRACCDQLIRAAASALEKVSSPINQVVQLSRKKIWLVDFCAITSLKVVNGIHVCAFKTSLIPQDSLKTLAQIKHEKEIQELRKELEKSIYPLFCRTTANYLNEVIPLIIGEKLEIIPSMTESWILFKMGYIIRYLNYQLDKHINYRTALTSSRVGKYVQGTFVGVRNQFAYLVSEVNGNSVLNFEHLLLRIAKKINTAKKGISQKEWMEVIIKSLAASFSQQSEIDHFLSQVPCESKEEAFIARLKWHKDHNSLPKGLPDPDQERLTPQNLQTKIDEALNQYLEGYIRQFFEQLPIAQFENKLLGILYFLEGKDALIQLLIFLISEFGIKQITDPHLFALAILYSNGIEIMDYELEGFGPAKAEHILKTGQKIMAETLQKNASWQSLINIYYASGLKHAPAGYERILQKQAAKERLKECIDSMIYRMIKPDEFKQSDTVFKLTRERVCQFPVIGAAAISLHLLINGTFFSLSYLMSKSRETYFSYLFKELSGKKLSAYLAKQIVELIYHPSWTITLMQLVEALMKSLESNKKEPVTPKDQSVTEELKIITEFLIRHFTQESPLPMQKNISSLCSGLLDKDGVNKFLEGVQSDDTSFLEKGLKSISSTIKELLLYTKITSYFRKKSVYFEGDAKFWEYFLRESLNRLVTHEVQQRYEGYTLSLAQLVGIREHLVDKLLSFDPSGLCTFLSKILQEEILFDRQGWEDVKNLDSKLKPDSFHVEKDLDEDFVHL